MRCEQISPGRRRAWRTSSRYRSGQATATNFGSGCSGSRPATRPHRSKPTGRRGRQSRGWPAESPRTRTELREADRQPLTDAEHAEHVSEVRALLDKARADGLATDRQHTIDPAREVWSDQRDVMHDSIIDDLYARASDVPCERRAIIAGGLPGAGKSTVLERYAGIDRSQYLTINPDDVKEEMARRDMIPPVSGLSPMEASDLVHEESSYVARQLALRAQADGKNVIWDVTMSSRTSTERRIDELRSSGYVQIEGIFIDIPVEISVIRADSRHREGQDRLPSRRRTRRQVHPRRDDQSAGRSRVGQLQQEDVRGSESASRPLVPIRQLWSGSSPRSDRRRERRS